MDVGRGHLVSDINLVPESLRASYQLVPDHLARSARRALAGRDEAVVSPESHGMLATWARKQRNKAKAKRKMASASRRGNRT